MKEQVMQLIGGGNLSRVFRFIKEQVLPTLNNTDAETELILLESRFNKNEKDHERGFVTTAEYRQEETKITSALIDWVNEWVINITINATINTNTTNQPNTTSTTENLKTTTNMNVEILKQHLDQNNFAAVFEALQDEMDNNPALSHKRGEFNALLQQMPSGNATMFELNQYRQKIQVFLSSIKKHLA